MKFYVGLDVSLDPTSVCVVDRDGAIIKECKPATDPEAIGLALQEWTDSIERVGLEAQALPPWLSAELIRLGLPAIVVETVHMQRALSAQRNKTDRNDARGIAQMMRTGWFRTVHVTPRSGRRSTPLRAACLFAARSGRACAPWGMTIAKRRGHKKAVVAVARKLASVLHTMWRDGTEFRWSTAA